MDKYREYREIGFKVLELLKQQGLSQSDLKNLLGKSDTYISNRINGEYGFSILDLKTISQEYNVSVDYLLGLEKWDYGRATRTMINILADINEKYNKMEGLWENKEY